MDFQSEPSSAAPQRSLAAIVFTDVVGYSRHAQIDETRTIQNFQRDFKIIESICLRLGGKVLKTLGDGVLMQFPSAIQALQCAIDIQQSFFKQSQELQIRDILDHRIGVHLGDIISTETDILGDGVNIANRLQSEAKSGSILFSRTVYDVVKGKLVFNAVCLGPRALKGIKDPIVVWEIPAIRQQEVNKRNQALEAFLPANQSVSAGSQTLRLLGLTAVAILVIAIASIVIWRGVKNAQLAQQRNTAAELHRGRRIHRLDLRGALNPSSQPSLPAGSKSNSTAVAPLTDSKSPTQATGAGTSGNQIDSTSLILSASNKALSDPAEFSQLKLLFANYDFLGMANLIQQSKYADMLDGKSAISTYEGLASLMTWQNKQLGLALSSNPVTVNEWPATNQPAQIFLADSNTLSIKIGSVLSNLPILSLTKDQTVALDQALLVVPGSTETTPKSVILAEISALQEEANRFK